MEYEYKLYVGHGNVQEVAEVVKEHVDGATLTHSTGIWKGEVEASTVVTVFSPLEDDRQITYWLALELRNRFHQDCVLVTRTEVAASYTV